MIKSSVVTALLTSFVLSMKDKEDDKLDVCLEGYTEYGEQISTGGYNISTAERNVFLEATDTKDFDEANQLASEGKLLLKFKIEKTENSITVTDLLNPFTDLWYNFEKKVWYTQ